MDAEHGATGEPTPPEGPAERGDDARDRAAAAAHRGEELARRGQELTDRLARLRAGGPADPADAVTAADAERTGRRTSADAQARLGRAVRRSADAHDRAAAAHDRAADREVGDVDDHRARAESHRRDAAADRRAARDGLGTDQAPPGDG